MNTSAQGIISMWNEFIIHSAEYDLTHFKAKPCNYAATLSKYSPPLFLLTLLITWQANQRQILRKIHYRYVSAYSMSVLMQQIFVLTWLTQLKIFKLRVNQLYKNEGEHRNYLIWWNMGYFKNLFCWNRHFFFI